MQVLGCTCGDDRCSWAALVVRSRPEAVRWDGFTTSRCRRDAQVPLEPVVFDRVQYEAALAHPCKADAPVRPYGS